MLRCPLPVECIPVRIGEFDQFFSFLQMCHNRSWNFLIPNSVYRCVKARPKYLAGLCTISLDIVETIPIFEVKWSTLATRWSRIRYL